MKKKILALLSASLMLALFTVPAFAQGSNESDNQNDVTSVTRVLPSETRTYTKTKTVGGVTVSIKINCTETYTGVGSIVSYTSGNCSVASVSGGTVTITGDFKSGTAGIGVDDDLIVIVYFNYKPNSGSSGSSSISFTIRGNSLV